MADQKDNPQKIAAVYDNYSKQLTENPDDEDIEREAARELTRFGLEWNDFLGRKLEKAPPIELRLLLRIVRHIEQQEIGERLESVVVKRVIPLDLKVEFFHVMADLGHSIDSKFLQNLQETEELYLQITSHLKSEDDEGLKRAVSLSEDIFALPATLKLSFFQELKSEWAEKALPFIIHIIGKDPDIDPALVEMLSDFPNEENIAVLTRIAENTPDKSIAKRIRKILYVMKEKGLSIETPAAKSTDSPMVSETTEDEQAFSSTFDPFGGRLLLLSIPSLGQYLVCQASIDNSRGLLRFSAADLSRKAYRELLKELKEGIHAQGFLSLVKIDPDHCRWLLQEAYNLNLESDTLIPERYKSLRYRLKPRDDYQPSELLNRQLSVSKEDIAASTNRPEELFEIAEIANWLLEKDQLLPFTNRYVEMAESRLVLDENQRKARLDDLIADFVSEYFTEKRMGRMTRRLQETAYLLAMKGNREESVKLAAVAVALRDHSSLKAHPFLKTFMLRSIIGTIQAFSQEQDKRLPENESGIIRPD